VGVAPEEDIFDFKLASFRHGPGLSRLCRFVDLFVLFFFLVFSQAPKTSSARRVPHADERKAAAMPAAAPARAMSLKDSGLGF
jgi:hypothetical protein